MNKTKLIIVALTVSIGVFMIFFGEMDDSPGAQLIGVMAIIAGIILVTRTKKKGSH